MFFISQVFKFSPLGSHTQRLLVLGDKLVPGSGSSRFCKPTSVAVDRNGEFFVADGYVVSEIVFFYVFLLQCKFVMLFRSSASLTLQLYTLDFNSKQVTHFKPE